MAALAPAALAPAAPPAAGRAVRETLDAVFRLPAFRRPLDETFWGWVRHVLARVWRFLVTPAVSSPAAFWLVVGLALVAVVYGLTRAVQRREGRARAAARRSGGGAEDPRQAAERAAAAGDYAAAAHHVYAAVLDALVARGLVRAHPAKTAGDYARELRRAPARAPAAAAAARTAAAGPYAAFARGYEAVVYGPRAPDRARYEALCAAAAPLLDPADAARAAARAGRRPARGMTAPATPAPLAARRRDRRLLVGAVTAVVVLGGVLGAYTIRNPPVGFPLDAESPLPGGALGLFEAARRLGWRPARAELPLARTSPAATYVAIRAPHGVREADAGRLLAAVRAGAGLVVDVRPDGDPLSDSLGLRLAAGRAWPLDNARVAARVGAADALTRPGCARAAVDASDGTEFVAFVLADGGRAAAGAPGLRTFVDVANARGDSTSAAGAALGVPNGRTARPADARNPAPALVGFPLGRGRVVAVADASLFTNAALETCWAAAGPAVVRALEWVSPAQGRRRGMARGALVFLQGRREVPGAPDTGPSALGATWRALTEVPAGRALAQALGAALVLLAALAARAVAPLPLARAQRRSPREYVGALAHAYREARATRLVARRLARGLRRRYGGPAAVRHVGAAAAGSVAGAAGAGDADARFLAAVAERHPAAAADAARLAEAARAAVPPSGLAAVGEAAARLDAVLATARRGA